MRRSRAILALVFLGLTAASAPPAVRAAELRDLRDLGELRALVDRDTSIPRLVLLLSPT